MENYPYSPYIMDYFPYILISNIKRWEKYGFIFHLSWYLVDSMENKRKFISDPVSKGERSCRACIKYSDHYRYAISARM